MSENTFTNWENVGESSGKQEEMKINFIVQITNINHLKIYEYNFLYSYLFSIFFIIFFLF